MDTGGTTFRQGRRHVRRWGSQRLDAVLIKQLQRPLESSGEEPNGRTDAPKAAARPGRNAKGQGGPTTRSIRDAIIKDRHRSKYEVLNTVV